MTNDFNVDINNLGKGDKTKILAKIEDRYRDADNDRKSKYVEWQEYERLYHSITLRKDKRAKRSNIFVPHIFTAVQTIVPRLVEVIYNQGKIVDVLPRIPDDKDRAELLSALIQYQFDIFPSGFLEIHNFVLQTLKLGTSILKVLWDADTESVIFKHVDLGDFWIDPLATTIDTARYAIHRIETTWEHVKDQEKAGVYSNVDKAKNSWDHPDTSDSLRMDRLDQRGINGSGTGGDSEKNKVVLHEVWTEKSIITVINWIDVIRIDKNAYGKLPFLRGVDYPEENSFYGIGEIEVGKDLQREINKKRNQRMDVVDLIINPLIMHDSSKVDVGELFQIYPGKIISSKDAINGNIRDALNVWSPPDTTGASVREEEMLKAEFQNTLSVSDFMQGNSGPKMNDTATGMAIIAEQMTKRFKMKADLMLYMVILPLGRMILDYFEKFMTMDGVIRVASQNQSGPEFTTVSPDMLKNSKNFDLRIVGFNQFVNKVAEQQNMTQMFQNLSNPQIQQGLMQQGHEVDMVALTKDYLKTFDKSIDIIQPMAPQPPQQVDPSLPIQPGQPQGGSGVDPTQGQAGQIQQPQPSLTPEQQMAGNVPPPANGQLPAAGTGMGML